MTPEELERLIRDDAEGDFPGPRDYLAETLLDRAGEFLDLWRAAIAYRNYTYDSNHGLAGDHASDWGAKLDKALTDLERARIR
jgi:hypothetical protein